MFRLINEKFESRKPIITEKDFNDAFFGNGTMNAIQCEKDFETKEEALAELKNHSCTAYKESSYAMSFYVLNAWYVVEEDDESGELSDWYEIAKFEKEEKE